MPATVNVSNYMLLPIPAVGIDPGPDWATQINNCLTRIDQHTHVAGYGQPVPVAGLNIATDFPMNSNRILSVKELVFTPQVAAISPTGVDQASLYSVNGELYYNDLAGNSVPITHAGHVAAANGSIAGLISPAAANFGSGVFLWQANVGAPIAANMDFGSAIMRNNTSGAVFGLTLSPPVLSTNYIVTLPPDPSTAGGTKIMQMDTSGAMTATLAVDGTTLTNSGTTLAVGVIQSGNIDSLAVHTGNLAAGAVTTAKIAPGNVTGGAGGSIASSTITTSNLVALNYVHSGPVTQTFSSGSFVNACTTPGLPYANARPIQVSLQFGTAGGGSMIYAVNSGSSAFSAFIRVRCNGSTIVTWNIAHAGNIANLSYAPGGLLFLDTAARSVGDVYYADVQINTGSQNLTFYNISLVAYEL